MNRTTHIVMIIPELLHLPHTVYAAVPAMALRRFESMLSRARVDAVQQAGLEAQVLRLAGLAHDPARDLPIAALSRLGEEIVPDDGSAQWWMRCDPVHLRADRDQLLVFHPHALHVTSAEAATLVASINAHFAGDGWRLHMAHPERWYLAVSDDPGVRNYDLAEVCGRAMGAYMPTGTRARQWRALLNELQMLLHAHAVNQAREAQGQPTINGAWLWGVGALPAAVSALPWRHVFSDEPFARGVARLHNVAATGVPDHFSTLQRADVAGSNLLLVLSGLRVAALTADAAAMAYTLVEILERWLVPAADALVKRSVAQLTIYPCDGRAFRLTPSLMRRFWRRRRPISHWQRDA